jgi:hypothetical protein
VVAPRHSAAPNKQLHALDPQTRPPAPANRFKREVLLNPQPLPPGPPPDKSKQVGKVTTPPVNQAMEINPSKPPPPPPSTAKPQ